MLAREGVSYFRSRYLLTCSSKSLVPKVNVTVGKKFGLNEDFHVGRIPYDVVFSPHANSAYVANAADDNVGITDVFTHQQISGNNRNAERRPHLFDRIHQSGSICHRLLR